MVDRDGGSAVDYQGSQLEEPLLSTDTGGGEVEGGGENATTNTNSGMNNDDEEEDDWKNIVIRECRCCCSCSCKSRQSQQQQQLVGRRPQRRKVVFRMNHNVFVNLVLSITYGFSDSLWGDAIFAAYLKNLYQGKNAPLGRIEALHGFATLLTAFPIGWIADTQGRSLVIRAGSALFVVTSLLHAATTYWIGDGRKLQHEKQELLLSTQMGEERDMFSSSSWTSWLSGDNPHHNRFVSMILLSIVMFLWGIGTGIVDGPCEALFADSTPRGKRATYYTYLEIGYVLSSISGPLVTIVLFHSMGNDWTMPTLQTIIYIGLAMESVNAIVMMFFDDRKALDEDDQSGDDDSDDRDEEEVEDKEGEDDDVDESNEKTDKESTGADLGTTTLPVSDGRQWIASAAFSGENPSTPLPSAHLSNGRHQDITPEHNPSGLLHTADKDTTTTLDRDSNNDDNQHSKEPLFRPIQTERNQDEASVTRGLVVVENGDLNDVQQESWAWDTAGPASNDSSDYYKEYRWLIPYIIFLSDFISCCANGLSVTFFPVFLKDDCGMSPIRVQVMYAVTPIFCAAMTAVATKVSSAGWGPVMTICVFYFMSVAFFFAIAVWANPFLRQPQHHWILVTLYILLDSFGSSISPLEDALLMDNVPRRQRARWMSLDAIKGFSFSATAFFGGHVCDRWGYQTAFFITCFVDLVALAFYACLLPLVPKT